VLLLKCLLLGWFDPNELKKAKKQQRISISSKRTSSSPTSVYFSFIFFFFFLSLLFSLSSSSSSSSKSSIFGLSVSSSSCTLNRQVFTRKLKVIVFWMAVNVVSLYRVATLQWSIVCVVEVSKGLCAQCRPQEPSVRCASAIQGPSPLEEGTMIEQLNSLAEIAMQTINTLQNLSTANPLPNITAGTDLHQIWFGKQTGLSASIDQTGKNHHHSKSTNLNHMQCFNTDKSKLLLEQQNKVHYKIPVFVQTSCEAQLYLVNNVCQDQYPQ